MKQRNLSIFFAVIALSITLIGGYFALRQFGVLSKRQVTYTQPNLVSQLAQQPETSVGSSQQEANINSGEKLDSSQQPVISGQEGNVAVDNQSSVASTSKNTDNKKQEVVPVEKNSDTAKSSDAKAPTGAIINRLVSWGFQKATSRTIKAIIVHTSYNALGGDLFDSDKVIQEWKDAGVAPHYMIARDGTIFQLVADQNIAWHAGSSKLPDGTTDVNGASIGIEVVNSQDAKFADAQYDALNNLVATLKKKYAIKYILGHDEISPGRKTDPWNIDWKKVNR